MDRTEEQIVVVIERWGLRQGSAQNEWIRVSVRREFNTHQEDGAWSWFEDSHQNLEKNQRVRMHWDVVRHSPPTPQMIKWAEQIAKNSNANPKKDPGVHITAQAGELRTVLESTTIAEAYTNEKIRYNHSTHGIGGVLFLDS
jgi:hypothetical protein